MYQKQLLRRNEDAWYLANSLLNYEKKEISDCPLKAPEKKRYKLDNSILTLSETSTFLAHSQMILVNQLLIPKLMTTINLSSNPVKEIVSQVLMTIP